MNDARGIANFFLDRAWESSVPVTIMTLLKLLYFAHAWHLAKYKRPLIAQPFEAWKYGPVNRVVYDQFRDYGKRPLDKRAVSFNPDTVKYEPTPYDLDGDTSKFLSNIFDYYAAFHPYRLSDLTHETGGPWDLIWRKAESQAVPGMIIPNDLIAAWFHAHGGVYSTDRERRFLV